MLNQIILWSLKNRIFVLAAAVVLVLLGGYQASRLPVDVFPDLNRPTVVIMTETPRLAAPEEVELLVTRPIEYQVNGVTGVERLRSSSAVGLSIVWVEFAWDFDIYRARQLVAEKLENLRDRLPRGAQPTLTPISSIMGEILLVGLRSRDGRTGPMELRTFADYTLRNRLLAIKGVAQVNVLGGLIKQYQVLTNPARLAAQGVTLEQVVEAAAKSDEVASGGLLEGPAREAVVRISSRIHGLKDIEETPIVTRGLRSIRIKDVADVRIGGAEPRLGDAGLLKREDGEKNPLAKEPEEETHSPRTATVILTVQKQPHADTLTLTNDIDQVLDSLEAQLPAGVQLEKHLFRQADFISAAIHNVEEAIRDGAIWVFLILLLFLWNLRATAITLTAIPLSILITALVFHYLGVSINTMTLGGIAVAVGELVDDAIVDIENINRRLKQGTGSDPWPLAPVYEASSEIRNSIVFATLIVCVAALPLFALGGLEGRLFAPLGLAYVVALAASLLVSLTVTPVLASFLLMKRRSGSRPGEPVKTAPSPDPFLLRILKRLDAPVVRFGLRHPFMILGAVGILAFLSLVCLAGMGGNFLPAFNEGTLTINVLLEPGMNLQESNRIGERVERMLLEVPEVLSVARRTGRAEQDEHAEGRNSSELDVVLVEHLQPKPGTGYAVLRGIPFLHSLGSSKVGRPREEVMADIQSRLGKVPGVKINVGQPISHRLDHILSGVRAQVAVKIFGPDPRALREIAHDVQDRIHDIAGVVDLQIEPQVEIPQVHCQVRKDEAKRLGLSPADLIRHLETALQGRVVVQVLEDERMVDMIVRYEDASRSLEILGAERIKTPIGQEVSLKEVVTLQTTTGPNVLNRENLQPRIFVSCNVSQRDLAGVIGDIKKSLAPIEEGLGGRDGGYRLEYGGQFEAQEQANRRLLIVGCFSLALVFLLLCQALESWRSGLQVLVNIPLAAFGSVLALVLTNHPTWAALKSAAWYQWPQVWLAASTLSVAHWVGFLTLVGIVSRNGIMMISHYHHLMNHEGEKFDEAMILRGSLERLAPVLMTASVAIMGLIPLALGAGQTGKEILQPLAVVVIGGLAVSTILDQVVTPALFLAFGKK